MYGVEIPNTRHGSMGNLRVVARGPAPSRPAGVRGPLADLAAAAAKARADFGVGCFWNAPVLSDPVEDARLVAGRLRRYGGRRGWAAATGIDKALREAAGAFDGVDTVPARGAGPSRPQPVA